MNARHIAEWLGSIACDEGQEKSGQTQKIPTLSDAASLIAGRAGYARSFHPRRNLLGGLPDAISWVQRRWASRFRNQRPPAALSRLDTLGRLSKQPRNVLSRCCNRESLRHSNTP